MRGVNRRKLNFFVEQRRIRLGLNVLEPVFFRHTYVKLDQGPGRCWMTLWRREWVMSPPRVAVKRDELKLCNDIELKLCNDIELKLCNDIELKLLNDSRCYTWMSHVATASRGCWMTCGATHVLHMFYTCSMTRGATGSLRLVGSLKWYVSFAEYSLFYRAILQKRPIILRSLLIDATLSHVEWLAVLRTNESCRRSSMARSAWAMLHMSHVTHERFMS